MWKQYEYDGESFGVYNANGHLVIRHKERNATITPGAESFGVAANREWHKAPNIEQATELACKLLLQACESPQASPSRECAKTQDFFDGLDVLQLAVESE